MVTAREGEREREREEKREREKGREVEALNIDSGEQYLYTGYRVAS